MNRKLLIDYDEVRNLFNEEYKQTMQLIQDGEAHLDNLAEGFTEADRVLFKLLFLSPQTNADRIRSMSDEELAAFMFSMVDCVSCENKLMNNGELVFGEKRKTCTDKDYHAMCNGDGRKCEAVCLAWLKQPTDGGE